MIWTKENNTMNKILVLAIFITSLSTIADESSQAFWQKNIDKKDTISFCILKSMRFTPCTEKETSASILSTLLFSQLKTYDEIFSVEVSLCRPMKDWMAGFYGGRGVCVTSEPVQFTNVINVPINELSRELNEERVNIEGGFRSLNIVPSQGEKIMSLLKSTGHASIGVEEQLRSYASKRMMNYALEASETPSVEIIEKVLYAGSPVVLVDNNENMSIIWGLVQTAEGKFFLECIPSELDEISCVGRQDEQLKEMIKYCQNKALQKEYKERLKKTIHYDILATDDDVWANSGIKIISEKALLNKCKKLRMLSNINFKSYEHELKKLSALYYIDCNNKETYVNENLRIFTHERTKYEFNLTDDDLDTK